MVTSVRMVLRLWGTNGLHLRITNGCTCVSSRAVSAYFGAFVEWSGGPAGPLLPCTWGPNCTAASHRCSRGPSLHTFVPQAGQKSVALTPTATLAGHGAVRGPPPGTVQQGARRSPAPFVSRLVYKCITLVYKCIIVTHLYHPRHWDSRNPTAVK